MKQLSLILKNWIKAFLYPRPLIGFLYLPRFIRDLSRYKKAGKVAIKFTDLIPCLGDLTPYTPFDAHYFFQGAWLARRLVESSCSRHVDVGSSALTIGISSAIVPTIFVDFRPLPVTLSGLSSLAGDILELPFATASVKSLSCLHVVEHIGLGRYGDAIDPNADTKAADELCRVLRPDGTLYLSIPIGNNRLCFNAHRVYSPDLVLEMFSGLILKHFSYVDDHGLFHENQKIESITSMQYGCGLFVLKKPGRL